MNKVIENYKDKIGIFFFLISIILFMYMFISPLNKYIIHSDEYFTIWFIQYPIGELMRILSIDVHPPLYYLILKFVADFLGIFGITSKFFIFKIVSFIPYGLILIVSAIKLRKEYGWFTIGLFTFAFGIMSEFFKYFETIRMYSWVMLFLVLAYIYLHDVITKKDLKSWVLLAVFSVLAAYTHYFGAMSAFFLYLLLLGHLIIKNKNQIKNWLISVAIAIILYIPCIFMIFNQLTTMKGTTWIPKPDLSLLIDGFGYFASGYYLESIMAILFLILLVVLYYVQDDKDEDYSFVMIGIGAYVLTIVFSTIISIVYKPIIVLRYLLPVSAVLWFSISVLISKLKNKETFAIAFVLIIILFTTGFGNVIHDSDSLSEVGVERNNLFAQITQNKDSIIIQTAPTSILRYNDYFENMEVYSFPFNTYRGQSTSEMQEFFGFKVVDKNDVTNLVANNPDKDIYIIFFKNVNMTFDPSIKHTKICGFNDIGNDKIAIYKLTSNV